MERSNASLRKQPWRDQLQAKWTFFLRGERPEPVPAVRGPVEPVGASGICCSGGGIRSAAFNLGALQALQAKHRIEDTDYIAAVSGGAYIAAAYCMVATPWRPGTPAPERNDSNPALLEDQKPFAPGSPEEQYLRNRSSYMAPDMSAKLYLGFRLLLGMAVNVAFLALPLIAFMLLATVLFYEPLYGANLEAPRAAWLIPVALLGLGALVGGACVLCRARNDACRRASEIWSVRLLAVGALAAILTLALPALARWDPGASQASIGSATGLTGFAGLAAGVLACLREALAAAKKAGADAGRVRGWAAQRSPRLRRVIMQAGAAVAGPLLLLTVAVGTLVVAVEPHGGDDASWLLERAAIAIALLVVLYRFADLTSWSLHPFYKRRLCTAFALKRIRPQDDPRTRHRRHLTHEQATGIAIERDFDTVVSLSETALDGGPTLLVCAAANVSDPGATPPGRRVTSFTFSANTIGGPLVGALPTTDFEHAFDSERRRWSPARMLGLTGRPRRRRRDLSLPAAVAMSGAAISPSSGKLGSRSLTFLMTLANMRLGVWVPNPTWVAGASEGALKRYGRPRPSYLVRELLGRNRLDGRYLYVSDGGHYENLGLVELLRRGCTQIYCFDASGGRTFAALGDAVALARSELGVEIDIDPEMLTSTGDPLVAPDHAIRVNFRYRCGTPGVLVYARNVVGPRTPWDVRAHQLADTRFPHDSTMDQLYTDQKFESYRALGERSGERAIELMDGAFAAPATSGQRAGTPSGLGASTATARGAARTPPVAAAAADETAAAAPPRSGAAAAFGVFWSSPTNGLAATVVRPARDGRRRRG